MDSHSFFLGKAFGLLSLILIAGFLSGIYLIWRDGFALAPFLTSAASLALLVAGFLATRKKS